MLGGMHTMIFHQDRLVPTDAVRVSPFDHGLTVGDGVFESLITYAGRPFALRRHFERLQRSAKAMGLETPGFEQVREAVRQVVTANDCEHARLRLTVTRGEAPLGSEHGSHGPGTFLVASAELPQRPPLAEVHLVPWTRNERGALTQVKSTSYGENVVALAAAHARGAQEAIFLNTQGHLCEGSGSNLFLVQEGRLCTPPLSSGCLAGITRGIVLELAAVLGMPVEELPLPLAALHAASEAFLTSTFREVQPISKVDDQVLPLGPLTLQLQEAFRQRVLAKNPEDH